MKNAKSRIALAFALCASAMTTQAAGTVLLRDDFNGVRLDRKRWDVANWTLGRTNLGNAPVVSGGLAQLRFDTYQFAGTEMFTRASYARGNGIEFEARMRLNQLPDGLVAAMFTYQANGGVSDEIDIEILSKQVNLSSGGAPLLLSTWNDWDEANPTYDDGIHHKSQTVKVNGLDVNAFHTYTVRWLPTRTEWLVDGVLIASSTQAQPDLATPFRINLWAPASGWTDAYAASLQPVTQRRKNASYYVDVDWVEIRKL